MWHRLLTGMRLQVVPPPISKAVPFRNEVWRGRRWDPVFLVEEIACENSQAVERKIVRSHAGYSTASLRFPSFSVVQTLIVSKSNLKC